MNATTATKTDNRGRPMREKRDLALSMLGTMTYTQIAAAIDAKPDTVRSWARQSGYRSPRSLLGDAERSKVLLLAGTMTDLAVSTIVGCAPETVRRLRVASGIEPYRKHPATARSRKHAAYGPIPERDQVAAWAVEYDLPFTTRDYAAAVGIAHKAAISRVSRAARNGDIVAVEGARGLYVTP